MQRGPIEYSGFTFLFVSQDEDPENGPYFKSFNFSKIKILLPQTKLNPDDQWQAKNEETDQIFTNDKGKVVQMAATWVAQKEKNEKAEKSQP